MYGCATFFYWRSFLDLYSFFTMRFPRRSTLAVLAALAMGACGFAGDVTPNLIRFEVSGSEGETVSLIATSFFVAAEDEFGTIQVSILLADTIAMTLPIDTVFDIEFEHQIFFQMRPMVKAELDVRVEIHVDGRSLMNDRGLIFLLAPWRFVYLFNRVFATDNIDVVI